jgi:aminocarboxymuconate-semialdehyde decarboxylase
MIIDFSCHLISREVEKLVAGFAGYNRIKNNFVPESSDPDIRLRLMAKYGIDMQVLSQTTPILVGLKPDESVEICRVSNDAIGRLCLEYPKSFIPFAVVSLQNVPEAVRELRRAYDAWGMRGVTVGTNHDNKGLDHPDNYPFFELVSELDLPVFLHPMDWKSYNLIDDDPAVMRLFGWPFDTTQAIMRLVMSGTMERFPSLRVVTHHLGGGMLPYYHGRFAVKFEKLKKNLQRPVAESFARIYGDTAVDGSWAALPCGHAFFGTDRMLFGTDYPFSPESGELYLRENLSIIKEWKMPDGDKAKILGGNAMKLLKLR